MSEADRKVAIATLAEAFNVKDLSVARIKILDKALGKVPAAVLTPMVERVIATRKPRWGDLPTVAELLEDAEACRRELLVAIRFLPCASCEPHGWVEVEVKGVKRLARCRCWCRHHERIIALGGPVPQKQIPGGEVNEPEGQALDDCPLAISDQVRALAVRRRL